MPNLYPQITKKELNRIAHLNKNTHDNTSKSFIIDGEKGVLEAINSGWKINQIVIEKSKLLKYNHINFSQQNTFIGSINQLAQISKVKTSPGILAEVIIPQAKQIAEKENIVFLINISDPGNLGSIIRSCDWFNIKNIIISSNTVDPFNSKVIRSTMGSIYRLNLEISANYIQRLLELKKQGYSLVATTINGNHRNIPKPPYCLIMGNESIGLEPDIVNIASSTYSIPKYGRAESLNVAVACAIILFDITTSK